MQNKIINLEFITIISMMMDGNSIINLVISK